MAHATFRIGRSVAFVYGCLPGCWLLLVSLSLCISGHDPRLGSCPAAEPVVASSEQKPERDASRDRVQDHAFSNRRLVATDLTHGAGFCAANLTRVWTADLAIDEHFGPGWSDEHDVRVWSVTPNTVIIVRGGRGWRIGRRKGEVFEVSPQETIKETAQGWEYAGPLKSAITFDDRWLAISESSPFGQVTTYTYDEQGRLKEVGLNAGNCLRYFYDDVGDRVSRIEGPEGLESRYEYDQARRLAAVTNSRQVRIQYQYDEAGYLADVSDAFGGRMKVPREVSVASDRPSADKSGRTYNAQGMLESQQIQGRTVRFTYDEAGRLAACGGAFWKESYEYDPFGRVAAVIGTDGLPTRLQYNALGLPVTVINPDGLQIHLQYDKHGRLTRGEDSRGNWEEYGYDAWNRISLTRRSPEVTERFLRDEAGRLTGIDYSTGDQARYQYDGSGRLTVETWGSGADRRWVYDDQGRCIERSDRSGLVTRFGFDPSGRKSWEQDAARGRTSYSYPDPETIVADRPGLGRWLLRRTPWQAPLEATDPTGLAVRYLYDEYQQLTAFIERSGATWKYTYDDDGRLRAISAPQGQAAEFLYDAAGRLIRVTRAGLAWRELAYDPQGRLQTETSPTGIAGAYRYDTAGRLAELTGPSGKVAFRYHATGGLASVEGPDWSLQQTEHPTGDAARCVYEPAGLSLEMPVDRFGRTAGIKLNDLLAAYQYDERGRVAAITLPGGTALTITLDEAGRAARVAVAGRFETAFTYGSGARITGIDTTGAGGQRVFQESYTYDAVGNLTRLDADEQSPRQLAYDIDNRLAEVSHDGEKTSYGYDENGNLLSVTSGGTESRWELDPSGRPLRLGTDCTYEWDAAGNLARVRGSQQTAEHTFDAAGRLTSVRFGGQQRQYGYLPDGDRLFEKGPDGARWYAYLPNGLTGLKDESGVAWLLVYLPGTDRPLALCGSNGTLYLLVSDRLGSIRRVVDREGKVVATCDFGPFGEMVRATGEPPLAMYAGMVCDRQGLYYARQRYYDPALARFISIDPESGQPGFSGTHNAYAYAANNPYRYKDATGAQTSSLAQSSVASVSREFVRGGGFRGGGVPWNTGASTRPFPRVPAAPGAPASAGGRLVSLLRTPLAGTAVIGGAAVIAGAIVGYESDRADQAEREKAVAERQADAFVEQAARHLAKLERDGKVHIVVPFGVVDVSGLPDDEDPDNPIYTRERTFQQRIRNIRAALRSNLNDKKKPLDGIAGSRPDHIRKTGGKSEPVPLGLPAGGAKKKPPAAPNEEEPASSDETKKPKDDPTQPPGEPATPKPATGPEAQPTDPTIPKVGLPGPGSKFFNDPTNIDDLFDDMLGPAEEPKKPESPKEKDKDQTPLEPPEPKVEPVIPEDQDKPPTDPDAKPPGKDMPPPDQDTGQPGESDDNQPTDDGPATDDKGRPIEPWQRPIVDRIIDIMLGGDDAPHDPDGAGQPPAGEDPGAEPPHIPFGPDPPRIYEPPPPPWDPPTRRRPPLNPPENTPPPGPGPRTPPPQKTPPPPPSPPTKPPVKPQTVNVPNIVGLRATQMFSGSASSVLFNAGLSWNPQSLGPAPSKDWENRVARQDPPPGTRVTKGTKVTGYIYGNYAGGPASTPAGPAKPPTEPAKPPAKPPAEPAKPPAEPAKPPVEPAKPPTEPAKPPTEPGKPPVDTNKPPMEPTKPPVEPAKPPVEPGKPPVEPGKPPVEPGKPPVEPGKPPVEPGKPPVEPTTPPMEPDKPPVDPGKPAPPKPSRVKVPNLVGKKAAEAREALTTLGLVPESQLGKLAPTADQVLRVYSQDPAEETEVDVPSTVKLLIYNDPDRPLVSVPNVVGKTAAEARQAITEATLVPKLQMGKAAPDAEKSLQVYSQEPGAGTEAPAQSTVKLLIYSQLEGPMVTVPDVVGKTAADARQAVTGAKLSPKFQMGQAAPSPAQALQVYRQDPAAGTRVDEGTEVQLLIYGQETDEPATPPGTRLTVPSVIGLRAADAKRKIQDAGLAAQLNLGQAAPAADKAATVYQQDPPAGTATARGDRVKITFYDEMASDSKPPIKPVPPSRRPPTLAGQWKCSCGATWVFQQTGQKVTGSEVHGKEYIRGQEKKRVQVTRSVSGVFDGGIFRFTWQDSDGRANGSGEMAADREVSRLNWSMHDNVSGATWSGSISRATN